MSEQQQPKTSINFSSFADWCKHKDSLSEAARHTVEVLLKCAGTSDINEANRVLSSKDTILLFWCQISDITPLQSLINLTTLRLSNNQISDITALQSLTNLTTLGLAGNQISDITALQSLTNLTSLYLSGNKRSDITDLQYLTNLTSLHLSNNQISDITALQSLTNLTFLHLGNNQILDITALQYLTNLTSLYLHNNQISDITALQLLTDLTDLYLSNNQISDIPDLQSLTNLTTLGLENNRISDITPLQSLANLTSLDLCNNQISDITPLQSLTNLTSLHLSDNRISDITPLQSLTNLTSLHLYKNQISDITPLQSLTNLTELDLHRNRISDITALQSLTNLTKLLLHRNRISDITPLQSLTNLTELLLHANRISDITPLQSLTNLTELLLHTNQISDITPLQSLTNLTELGLYANQISVITPLPSLINKLDVRSLSRDLSVSINFTPQQKALIETCRRSLSYFANSTKPIDRAKASTALKVFYDIFDLETPEITFCSSPQEMSAQLRNKNKIKRYDLIDRLNLKIEYALFPFTVIEKLAKVVREILRVLVWADQLEQPFRNIFSELYRGQDFYFPSSISPKYLVKTLALGEFCVSGFGMFLKPESQKLFEALKQLLAECGWIFTFENVCYVCDRPIKLSLDNQYRLHAEGESAIEFTDGYKLYSYHGVTLPEKYGEVHPNNWQAEWILSENNAELRRILIQEIGYARIASELAATELDSWQEYTLLRIDADIDRFDRVGFREPIHLLKMTCPSTGFIHALRVPPNIASAREAIRWVNWDIAPEDFSVQT